MSVKTDATCAYVGCQVSNISKFPLNMFTFGVKSIWFDFTPKVNIQGQPLGFDTKYLALVDRNMQVRFSLKVVWEF
jgi:hypothetical protein